MPATSEVTIEFPEKLKFLFEPHQYKIAYGGRGGLKCLAVGTRVMMADGSLRAVEDVAVGDAVMGPDSLPRNVLSTTRGPDKLFRVRQSHAMDYVVNQNHVLSLRKRSRALKQKGETSSAGNSRRPGGIYAPWPSVVNIPVMDAAGKSEKWREYFVGYRAGLIDFPARAVKIDPYILGIWLGDGTGRECRVTSADQEIIDALSDYATSRGGRSSRQGKSDNSAVDIGMSSPVDSDRRKNAIWQDFLFYGLKDNKHIPSDYLFNDEKARLELLAGLLDSDGTLKNKSGYSIAQVNFGLARQIKQLADQLGFRTSIKESTATCHNNGAQSQILSISIGGDTDRIPCKVARKIVKETQARDHLLSKTTIDDEGYGEVAGFELDGDHLFCLEDGTVTHNSWSFARALLIMGAQRPLRILCARETQSSIKQSVLHTLKSQAPKIGLENHYDFMANEIKSKPGLFPDGKQTQFIFEGLRQLGVDNIKSIEDVDICWVEEARNLSQYSLDTLIPTIRKPGSEIWFSFNPILEKDVIYERMVKHPPANAKVKKIGWEDNKWLSDELKNAMADCRARCERLGNFDEFDNIWGGQCITTLPGAVYVNELREATLNGRITRVPYDASKPVHTFWDLGHEDATCIWFVQQIGFEYRFIDYHSDHHRKIPHYLKILQDKPYIYGEDWLPHDAAANLVGAARTIEQQFKDALRKPRIVPKLSLVNGINAARTAFDNCYFDETKCADGLDALRNYQYAVDPETNQRSKEPLHDWSSHGADAFRYFAVAFKEIARKPERKVHVAHIPGAQGWMR